MRKGAVDEHSEMKIHRSTLPTGPERSEVFGLGLDGQSTLKVLGALEVWVYLGLKIFGWLHLSRATKTYTTSHTESLITRPFKWQLTEKQIRTHLAY